MNDRNIGGYGVRNRDTIVGLVRHGELFSYSFPEESGEFGVGDGEGHFFLVQRIRRINLGGNTKH